MHHFPRKFSILGGIVLFLAVGGAASETSVQDAPQAASALSLVGDNIHAEIRKHVELPIAAASHIANDASVRAWLINGDEDPSLIARYLDDVKQRYGAGASFLVSEKTRRHYRWNGVQQDIPSDENGKNGFLRARDSKETYEVTTDAEFADGNPLALSVAHRILDAQGNFIGVAGAGITLDPILEFVGHYESRCSCSVYLVDKNGIILNGKLSMQHLRDHPGLRQVAMDILSAPATPMQSSFHLGSVDARVDSRLLPELGWHLVVERTDPLAAKPVWQVPNFNLAGSIIAAVLVAILFAFAISRYRRRLDNAAGIDTVTGLMNRRAYEFVFHQALLEINRSGHPLSLIQLEVDLPTRIGRLGLGWRNRDRIMRNLAQLAQKAVRNSDPVSRWSHNQLLIQLRDCPHDEAMAVAERLRLSTITHDFGVKSPDLVITVSLGVAQYQPQEAGSAFLRRVEDMLDLAKEKGRNRVEPEISTVTA